jgi:cytochrome c-type biogenesis protein
MDELLFSLTDALSAAPMTAFAAALAWGLVSVLLSPCHLGTIPLIVGFVGSGGASTRGRGTAISFAFAGGMLLAIMVIGVGIAWAGYAVRGFGAVTNYVLAGIFILAGLALMDLIPIPMTGLSIQGTKRRGVLAAGVLGLVFGIGLSPCTFAFLAPILGVAFGSAATRPGFGIALLFAFGLGHCAVIGVAGASADIVQRYLDWSEQSRAVKVVKMICGLLVLVSAAVMIYSA